MGGARGRGTIVDEAHGGCGRSGAEGTGPGPEQGTGTGRPSPLPPPEASDPARPAPRTFPSLPRLGPPSASPGSRRTMSHQRVRRGGSPTPATSVSGGGGAAAAGGGAAGASSRLQPMRATVPFQLKQQQQQQHGSPTRSGGGPGAGLPRAAPPGSSGRGGPATAPPGGAGSGGGGAASSRGSPTRGHGGARGSPPRHHHLPPPPPPPPPGCGPSPCSSPVPPLPEGRVRHHHRRQSPEPGRSSPERKSPSSPVCKGERGAPGRGERHVPGGRAGRGVQGPRCRSAPCPGARAGTWLCPGRCSPCPFSGRRHGLPGVCAWKGSLLLLLLSCALAFRRGIESRACHVGVVTASVVPRVLPWVGRGKGFGRVDVLEVLGHKLKVNLVYGGCCEAFTAPLSAHLVPDGVCGCDPNSVPKLVIKELTSAVGWHIAEK